ncbi:anti-sigma B factor RsbW [Paenibacillus sp. MBLB4367]|uniref:anti-sigma B factor RsbW n=1 Tax=Paenibacillus sp. MBLB4367 TaxID=3384767 RepID=UPI003908168A
MTMNPYVSLTVPANAEYLDIIRLTLYGFATKAGFSFEEIEDMKVAVAEACNNAILHAYGEGEPGTIDIRFENSGDGVTISVKDHGQSFSYAGEAGRAIPPHQNEISEVSVGGLGLFLMEALMDDVQVHADNGSGTEIVLTKRLSRKEEMA